MVAPQNNKPTTSIAMVMLGVVVVAIILIALLTVAAIVYGPPVSKATS